ncbi:Ventral anterior homeobox 2 [Saguinus oedipus]|uniref:Ventral anterior homeobox 2 n=1 Tax=Saguinus oedipus TaxID=9490 RepID=A0ABQ9U716_SAGOE|nr:Ventral anterior homeobox 2 [Saguinus oedipus]
MGDGGAERDRGPARRAESGGSGGRGGEEDMRADGGGRSPTEVAGTSASSPTGSRESGADSDGQPGPGEADHCRRILVREPGLRPVTLKARRRGSSVVNRGRKRPRLFRVAALLPRLPPNLVSLPGGNHAGHGGWRARR